MLQSIARLLPPFKCRARRGLRQIGKAAVYLSAGALIAYCIVRYLRLSSFWLDEAFVAASLRNPTTNAIFGRLAYAQYFPRLQLACIAALRAALRYRVWVLRLLPSATFVIATVLWAKLLFSRSRSHAVLGIFGAGMLLGAGFWLDQGAQLKQYTLDVLVALVPFIIDDRFFHESLIRGKRRLALAALALPCCFSYTYPIALFARILGWYIVARRTGNRQLRISSVLTLGVFSAVAIGTIYLTDYRFNLHDAEAYRIYWRDCSLNFQLRENVGGAPRLIAKFLWGWHGRMS